VTKEQTASFRAALKDARAAFEEKSTRLGAIEMEASTLKVEILKLRRSITALAPLCSEDPRVDKLGITDVCIEAMNIIPDTVSTADVVRWIEMYGYDISSQKNADASVHAILSRLADKGTIKKILIAGENGGVRWRGPNYDENTETGITDEDIPF